MSISHSVVAAVRTTLLSMPQRWSMSVSTIIGTGLVVTVLLGFLGMANGFRQMLEQTGSPNVAILLSKGARDEGSSSISAATSGLVKAMLTAEHGNQSVVSGELTQIVSVTKVDGNPSGLIVRGLSSPGLAVRKAVSITSGRMFTPGSREIVVGAAAAAQFPGLVLGKDIRLGAMTWRVVGVFDAKGSAFASEVWADVRSVQAVFSQDSNLQSIRVALPSPDAVDALAERIKLDARLPIDVKREDRFFAAQSKGLSGLITKLGWPLALCMAVGALTGALNTMYSSVSARTREIATLRAIGYGRFATFAATFAEAFVLSLAGAVVGVMLAFGLLHGRTGSTLGGGGGQLAFEFALTVPTIFQAVTLAVVVGAIGGLLPAWRAARQPILKGLAQ